MVKGVCMAKGAYMTKGGHAWQRVGGGGGHV